MKKLLTKGVAVLIGLAIPVTTAIAFAGCSNSEEEQLIGEFVLTEESYTFDKLGQSATLTAKVGETEVKDVTYVSSNEAVVKTVSNVLIATGNGNATITATYGDKEAVCMAKVTTSAGVVIAGDAVRNISTSGTSEVTLSATVNVPSIFDDDQAGITWSSSNTEVATVDKNGKVTAVSSGFAVITAESKYQITTTTTVTMMGMTLDTTEEKIESASVTIFVNNEFNATTNASILGTYNAHYDWQGFVEQASATNPCYTTENFKWIRSLLSLELKADGTFKQQVLNAQRKTYKTSIDSSLPESTYTEQVAKYGSNNCYVYNRYEQNPADITDAEAGKVFHTIEGMTASGANNFAENGYFAIFDGKLVLYFNGKTFEYGAVAENAFLAAKYVPFTNMVAMSDNMSMILTKKA